MIRQEFTIESYWKVIVVYDVDYSHFNTVMAELANAGASSKTIWEIYDNLQSGKVKAVTFSNIEEHISIVLFNHHRKKEDYINSIVHEAEHVKQAILEAYDVEDKGESPAYTIGYIISRMYKVFASLMCERH